MNFSIGDQLSLSFALLLARSAGVLMALPSMLGVAIPLRVRLLLSIVIAGALMPICHLAAPLSPNPLAIVLGVGRELVLGVTLAFASAIVVGAVLMAGDFVGSGMEIHSGGILRLNLASPNVIGEGFATFAGLLFFIAGFHRALLLALGQSLVVAPLGGPTMPGLDTILSTGGRMFLLALEIGLPVLIPLFLLAVTQGVVARLAPQVNVLTSAPAAIILGGLTLLILDAHGLGSGITRVWGSVMAEALRWLNG